MSGKFCVIHFEGSFLLREEMKFNENHFADNYNEIWGARVYSIADNIEEMTLSAQSLS